ncbi:MAG: ribosome-associated translation inhibitor RaiA [Alphaproteobacteria bacterium]|nr:ribosome-associated translation inhibitor RaiA [Alphaproteobacteria bacterium]MBV9014113.1 ribosome-associated translation inhibitor RaiA [Alphaproteobacteria bacterium]MBV9150442.1 ribosome-associated translation inhibitor RaiA [Alphaproteobacteria bacterium]MBV9586201.1 ribosome-associated translation inhibitor RaiA [Alphaproteobacteria bacterium]
MQLIVTGRQVDVGETLRTHVSDALDAILGKYFGSAIEAHVVFAREGHLIRAEIEVRLSRGILVNGRAAASEFYAAFDAAAERIAKQLRRYKRRLHAHHAKNRGPEETVEREEQARSYILAGGEDEAEEVADGHAGAPAVIAEMSTELPQLTVGEAVMRMDLADSPFLLFRNRSHGQLNLVYRRGDGNIGWIDPSLEPGRSNSVTAGRASR